MFNTPHTRFYWLLNYIRGYTGEFCPLNTLFPWHNPSWNNTLWSLWNTLPLLRRRKILPAYWQRLCSLYSIIIPPMTDYVVGLTCRDSFIVAINPDIDNIYIWPGVLNPRIVSRVDETLYFRNQSTAILWVFPKKTHHSSDWCFVYRGRESIVFFFFSKFLSCPMLLEHDLKLYRYIVGR